MKAVFVGGSRRLSKLSEEVRRRLTAIIEGGLWVYVGDANGADRAVQQFFADREYDRVLVYCVDGRYRNNLGHWDIKAVQPPSQARGFEYDAAKDIQMAADASYGMMLWDGFSRGTLANIRNLLAHRKPVAVYVSPRRQFRDLKGESDLAGLLSSILPGVRRTKARTDSPQREIKLPTHSRTKGQGL